MNERVWEQLEAAAKALGRAANYLSGAAFDMDDDGSLGAVNRAQFGRMEAELRFMSAGLLHDVAYCRKKAAAAPEGAEEGSHADRPE